MFAFIASPLGGLLLKVGAVLALAGLAWWAWEHYVVGHYEAIGAARVQAKWDADSARRIKATTDITLLWNDKRIAADKLQEERDSERAKRTEMAASAARNLPAAVSSVVVPRAAVGVLNNAIGDTAPTAGPAGQPAKEPAATAESADSTVGLLTQWGVQCIAAYEEARGMVTGWQAFYSSLRAAQ